MGLPNHLTPGEKACNNLNVSLKEYFESKLTEVERRLVSLNDLNHLMSQDRAKFVSRELHDRLQTELSDLEQSLTKLAGTAAKQSDLNDLVKIVTTLTTKISTWFLIVAGAYGLIQVGLSALFYHLFHQR